MRRILFYTVCVGIISSCSGGKAYKLNGYEKEAQEGYHANEANRLIDKNAQNKKANQKAAEKSKQEQNARLNTLNKNKPKGGVINNRTFNFY
ncbi:MAG TPA: hypothetical protein VK766_00720 [Cytophagaceae bacterium]|jgi:hypothetical protein|nr:hypothetical protein [Cytophagaceae bacterium]